MSKYATAPVGKQFGKWIVLESKAYTFTRGGLKLRKDYYWKCKCQGCGAEELKAASTLVLGKTKGCSGCHSLKHGMIQHPAYSSWDNMIQRCYNKKATGYRWYGFRGITVCETWLKFEGFWKDMGQTWRHGLTIERMDSDGNYEMSNCRWATQAEQAENRRPPYTISPTTWLEEKQQQKQVG